MRVVFGSPAQSFLILQNDTATIGLFQGMFDKNNGTREHHAVRSGGKPDPARSARARAAQVSEGNDTRGAAKIIVRHERRRTS
jgi:hypothetical protein